MSPWAALIKQFPRPVAGLSQACHWPVIDLSLACNRPPDGLPARRFTDPSTLPSATPSTLPPARPSSGHFRHSLPVLSLPEPDIIRRSRPDS